MKRIASAVVLSFALSGFAACDNKEKAQAQAAQAKREADEKAAATIKEAEAKLATEKAEIEAKAAKARAEARAEIQKQVDQAEKDLAALKEKAGKAKGAAKKKAELALVDLDKNHESFKANMARLDTVAGDAWDKTKAEIDMDLSKLRASISDFDAAVSKH